MSSSSNIAIIIIGGIAAFVAYSYFSGKGTNQTANSLGALAGNTTAAGLTGFTTGAFQIVNPQNPIAMQQNNSIRQSLLLLPDTNQTLYYPFTNIPINGTQQNNAIRSLFGLLPENNNVQYYPFTNIPIGRTA